MSRLTGHLMFVMSEQTAAIVKVLRGVNQDISYEALSRGVGFQVSGKVSALSSARRHLESSEAIVFETVYGEGLRRLDDTGKVTSTARHARTIGRAARRGRKRLSTVENFAALKPKDQLQATLRATQFEFAQQAVSTRKLPDIAKATGGTDIKHMLDRIKATA